MAFPAAAAAANNVFSGPAIQSLQLAISAATGPQKSAAGSQDGADGNSTRSADLEYHRLLRSADSCRLSSIDGIDDGKIQTAQDDENVRGPRDW